MDYLDLVEHATRRYVPAGRYPYHFSRGKLRHDPVFRALLEQGLLPDDGRLMDIGCGLGLLPALLLAARDQHVLGNWPQGWPAPPQHLDLNGVELLEWKVTAANRALSDGASIRQGDIRSFEFDDCSAITLIDVLMYLGEAEQRLALQRIVAALRPGGLLLMRENNNAAGLRSHITRFAEQLCCLWRGQGWNPLHYRSQSEWTTLLQELGLTVRTLPMSQGTPFANILYVATKTV